MPQASGPGKSVYLEVGIWWDEGQQHIHLTANNVPGFHTTVSNDPESKRRHQNLFLKLAKVLKGNDAPHPPCLTERGCEPRVTIPIGTRRHLC